jgi:hypothetical protein
VTSSPFKKTAWPLRERTSRRAVIKGGAAGAATGALGALGLRASAQEATAVQAQESTPFPRDLLPSWNDGAAREQLLAFIDAVTDESNDAFVEPADRIATFDNDGTLWCEMPLPQLQFLQQYAREQAEAHPELRTIQPYKAIWEEDAGFFGALIEAVYSGDMATVNSFMEIIMEPFAGMTPAEYEAIVQAFFESSLHPELGVPYRQLIYQPMVELVGLLQANAFDVYICTGGDRDFVRGISEDFYGIPRANVIGSAVELDYQTTDEGLALVRRAAVDQPFTDGPGKPVRIEMQVGRQPILVGGNSDGDVAMLAYAQEQHETFLGLLVHHDDAEREYAYDDGAEMALEIAGVHGWTVASMKEDFSTVFPVEDA